MRLTSFTDSRDRAGAVGAKYVGKLRLDAKQLGEPAFALEGVPRSHVGRFDTDQDLVRPDLGHGKRMQFERLRTAEAIDGDGLHGVLCCLFHDFLLS
jgi:hypothetical protein